MRNPRKSPSAAHSKALELKALLHRLVDVCRNPVQFIEVYYWSAEPELAEIMREYIALPDDVRNAIRAFLAMTRDCSATVRITVTPDGQVTLSSPVVSELMAKMEPARSREKEIESVH